MDPVDREMPIEIPLPGGLEAAIREHTRDQRRREMAMTARPLFTDIARQGSRHADSKGRLHRGHQVPTTFDLTPTARAVRTWGG
jgi:hypothetical protein